VAHISHIGCFQKKEAALGLSQLGVRFLDDSNSWNVNGTSNLRPVRQMLKVLSQLLTMFLHSLAYFSHLG